MNKMYYLSMALSSIIWTFELHKVTNENRHELAKRVKQDLLTGSCGICGKDGIEVTWVAPWSRGAHKTCYDMLLPIEEQYSANKIRTVLPQVTFDNEIHNEVLETVGYLLDEEKFHSIQECFQKNPTSLKRMYTAAAQVVINRLTDQ